MGKKYQSRRTCNKQEKNESRIRQSVVPIVTMRANWRLPKSGCRKAMGEGSEYPTRQRSFRSSLSRGKPCTWRREAANNFNANNGKCERHYEKSRVCIKQSNGTQ